MQAQLLKAFPSSQTQLNAGAGGAVVGYVVASMAMPMLHKRFGLVEVTGAEPFIPMTTHLIFAAVGMFVGRMMV